MLRKNSVNTPPSTTTGRLTPPSGRLPTSSGTDCTSASPDTRRTRLCTQSQAMSSPVIQPTIIHTVWMPKA